MAEWKSGSAAEWLELNRYAMTVEWSADDDAYIACCPEWRGHSAFGASRLEAVREAEIALEAMIAVALQHKMDLPVPKHLERYG